MRLSFRFVLVALLAFGFTACAPPKAPPPPPVKADPKPPPPKKKPQKAAPALGVSIGKIVVQRHNAPGPDDRAFRHARSHAPPPSPAHAMAGTTTHAPGPGADRLTDMRC